MCWLRISMSPGAATCDSEILSLGGTDQVGASLFDGFDYVALGHLHSPQKLCGAAGALLRVAAEVLTVGGAAA